MTLSEHPQQPKQDGKRWPMARPAADNQPKLTETQRMDAAYWHVRGGVPAEWIARDLGVHRSVVVRWSMKLRQRIPEGYIPELPEPVNPAPSRFHPNPDAAHVRRALAAAASRRINGIKRTDASVWDTTSQVRVPDETGVLGATPETKEAALALLAANLTTPPGQRSIVTLTTQKAGTHATKLEGNGWRAQIVHAATGFAYVEVRDLAVRGMPVVARLRTDEDMRLWHLAHPEHGLVGRVKGPPPLAKLGRSNFKRDGGNWPKLASTLADIGKWRTHGPDY